MISLSYHENGQPLVEASRRGINMFLITKSKKQEDLLHELTDLRDNPIADKEAVRARLFKELQCSHSEY